MQPLKIIQQNFLKELLDATEGKKTSLPFIQHTLPSSPLVHDDEVFQVLVIGGTIFRKALLKREGKTLNIIKVEEKNQPPFLKEGDFLMYVEKEIDPSVRVVALNFAYPMTPVFEDGRLDGILLSDSKESVLDDVIGKKLGKTIEEHVLQKHKKKIIVSVANDTICLVLAGLTQYPWAKLIGGIVGTGFNFALFLKEHTIVNIEVKDFDKFPQSDTGKTIDAQSLYPGNALFEKEVAGAYLYKHYNVLREKHGFPTDMLHSTQELDQIAQLTIPDASDAAKKLLLHSASLAAAAIGGLCLYKKTSLVFVVEGSLFWFADGYRQHIETCLTSLIPEYKPTFVKVDHSTIVGAAKLVSYCPSPPLLIPNKTC